MLITLVSFAFSALIAPHEEKKFLSWMRNTNQYYTSEDYHFRLGIFLTNQRRVNEFNSAKRSFKVGLNKFSCYTPSEYKVLLGHFQTPTQSRSIINQKSNDDIPEAVDWREKNVVNEIKDQGNCASCWAFGTIQACESAYAISHGTLYSCSEQNLVDCVNTCGGCSGGYEDKALDYIINSQNGYLNSENDYPYKAVVSSCRYDKTKGINKIESYEKGVAGDESYLKQLVAKGVCGVSINAQYWSFQSYTSGIYDNPDCIGIFLNHAVGLVGYGAENGTDYWLVRNSWGTAWGERGYFRILRGTITNLCGIASAAYVPYTSII